MTEIIIGIPTHRRPNGLTRLLKHLECLYTTRKFRVVVADNDLEKREGLQAVEELRTSGISYQLDAISSAQRGISYGRNDLIYFAKQQEDCKYLAMLDDDEWPSPEWLDAMIDTMIAFDADIVGGPLVRVFPAGTPSHIVEANTVPEKSQVTGKIRSLESTANILFDMKILQAEKDLFDPEFAITGGGDRDFLLRLRLKNAQFAWSVEATVYEDFPASRCTEKWTIQRAYRVGNTEMLAYLKNRPPRFIIKEAIKIPTALLYGGACWTILLWSKKFRLKGAVSAVRAFGKITALFGKRYFEYRTTHGN